MPDGWLWKCLSGSAPRTLGCVMRALLGRPSEGHHACGRNLVILGCIAGTPGRWLIADCVTMGCMSATMHDAVTQAQRVLAKRGNPDLAGHLDVAYAVVAADPLSRVRVPSVLHVALLLEDLQQDESLDIATRNAVSDLFLRIANAIGMTDPRGLPEVDRGVRVDQGNLTYRVDGANVLHFEVHNAQGFIVYGLHIRVVSSRDGEPPEVAAPGLRTGRSPQPDEEEQAAAWQTARNAVAIAWVLGLWEGREL